MQRTFGLMTRIAALLAIAVIVVSCRSTELRSDNEQVSRETGRYATPLIRQRADPWIYRHTDGFYYFMATVPEYDRLEIRRARTVADLPEAKPLTIWRKHETGPMGSHIWAPELHFVDGRWYVYFAAGDAEDIWEIRMYVLENDSENPLEGEWVEKGPISTGWESFSLDATTFAHNGTRYLVWAQHPPRFRGNTALYVAKMGSPWSIVQPAVEISRPEYDWEERLFKVNEGPAFIAHDDRVFLTYSASGTDYNYAMGLLWARADADLLDPDSWHKSRQPVFTSSDRTGVYGPGHNSFTVSPGGDDLLIYHARSYKDLEGDPLDDPNRHTRVQVFTWNDEGFPDFGEPVPDTVAP